MKKVLWISRHEMTAPQYADLEKVMQDKVELICWKDNVRRAEDLLPKIQQADAVAAVLPLQLMAQLLPLTRGKPVLQAVTERVLSDAERTLADGRKEKEVHFIHKHWEQVLKVDVQTRACCGNNLIQTRRK